MLGLLELGPGHVHGLRVQRIVGPQSPVRQVEPPASFYDSRRELLAMVTVLT